MRSLAVLLLALLLAIPAAAQPATERIGAWLLSCTTDRMTDRTSCRLQHRDPVDGAEPPLLLEIIERGGRYLPVLISRDIGLEGAGRVLTALTATAHMRFPPARMFEMPCGLYGRSVVCAPRPEDSARVAEEMLAADILLVRLVGIGGAGAQAAPVELRLDGIAEAVARLRARVPSGSGLPDGPPGLSLPDVLRRLQELF